MADKIVLNLDDVRPIWSIPDRVIAGVREIVPPEWEVFAADDPRDGTGDGGRGVSSATLDAVRDARIYMGLGIPAEVVRAGAELEWVHTITAGVGGSLSPDLTSREILLTNSAGIHAVPMAETVVGLILHFLRGLDFAVRGMARNRWWPDPFIRADTPVTELADSVVGILGYGGIGREVARRVSAMGARVLALRRHPPEKADAFAEVFHGTGGLERILGRSDVIVVTLPETEETRGLLDRPTLGRTKEGAILVNVARGAILDDGALVDALRSGHLRGAALDVFSTEPLPEGHPFWNTPNLLITPHVSAVSRRFWEREGELIEENLRRFLGGHSLLNEVDKAAGY